MCCSLILATQGTPALGPLLIPLCCRRLQLDGGVTSLLMDPAGQEGVAGTSGCTLWYITASPQVWQC